MIIPIEVEGKPVELDVPTRGSQIGDVAVDGTGNVWYTDLSGWLGRLSAFEYFSSQSGNAERLKAEMASAETLDLLASDLDGDGVGDLCDRDQDGDDRRSRADGVRLPPRRERHAPLGANQSVQRRREADDELRREHAQLDLLLTSLPNPVLLVDNAHAITTMNDEARCQ
mgnify:CR=1 FL=1